MVENDEVEDGGNSGQLVKKFSKVKKLQKPKKSGNTIGLEELSFLTSNTKPVFIEMLFSCTQNRKLPIFLMFSKTRNYKHKVLVQSYLYQVY